MEVLGLAVSWLGYPHSISCSTWAPSPALAPDTTFYQSFMGQSIGDPSDKVTCHSFCDRESCIVFSDWARPAIINLAWNPMKLCFPFCIYISMSPNERPYVYFLFHFNQWFGYIFPSNWKNLKVFVIQLMHSLSALGPSPSTNAAYSPYLLVSTEHTSVPIDQPGSDTQTGPLSVLLLGSSHLTQCLKGGEVHMLWINERWKNRKMKEKWDRTGEENDLKREKKTIMRRGNKRD